MVVSVKSGCEAGREVGVAEKGQLRGNQLLKDFKDLFLSVT